MRVFSFERRQKIMLTGKVWTLDDIIHHNVKLQISTKGIAIGKRENNSILILGEQDVTLLDPSETIFWYCCLFDSLEYDEIYERYCQAYNNSFLRRANIRLNTEFADVFNSMYEKGVLCRGYEQDKQDAIFNMFSNCNLRINLNEDNLNDGYTNGISVDEQYIECPFVNQTPKKTLPIINEERNVLDMLQAENWSMAEITRNLAKGYSVNMTRKDVPSEEFKLTEKDANTTESVDLIQLNYERHPLARLSALIVLALLKKRRIVLT